MILVELSNKREPDVHVLSFLVLGDFGSSHMQIPNYFYAVEPNLGGGSHIDYL